MELNIKTLIYTKRKGIPTIQHKDRGQSWSQSQSNQPASYLVVNLALALAVFTFHHIQLAHQPMP